MRAFVFIGLVTVIQLGSCNQVSSQGIDTNIVLTQSINGMTTTSAVYVINEGDTGDFTYDIDITPSRPGDRFNGTPAGASHGSVNLPGGRQDPLSFQSSSPSLSQASGFNFRPTDDGDFTVSASGLTGLNTGSPAFMNLGNFPYSGTANSVIRVMNVAPSFVETIPDLQIPFGFQFGLFFNAFDPGDDDTITFEWDYESDGTIDLTTNALNRYSETPFNAFSLPLSGELLVTVKISDDDGGESTQSILFSAFDGDYNDDGRVDAADYTVWRNSLGATGEGLFADGNRDGVVDALDYDIWKDNYGDVFQLSTAVSTSMASHAIPEPNSLVAIIITLTLAAASARR